MPMYMLQTAYTPESWAKLVQKPEDRREAVRPMLEKAGCKLVEMYFAFGKYDVVLIIEAPDATTAAAVAINAASAGHIRAAHTTALLTVEEAMAAMKKAGAAGQLKTPLSK
jgi:uncharacterized protein with GYD domain